MMKLTFTFFALLFSFTIFNTYAQVQIVGESAYFDEPEAGSIKVVTL